MATITNAQQTQILKLVAGLFNATPGASYLNDFANLIAAGTSMAGLANALAATNAFTIGIMGGKVTVSAQVQQLMEHFGLTYAATPTADTAAGEAQAWFTNQINTGHGFGAIVYDAVTALSDPAWVAANPLFASVAQELTNVAAVSAYYAATLGQSSTDLATLQRVVSAVTATTPISTEAELAAAIAAGGGSGGLTFTLTSATNIFNGGGGADSFIADLVNEGGIANIQTLNSNDTLDGGTGIDTLTATINSSVTPASLQNIEILNISHTDTISHTLTLTNANAITTLKTGNNTAAITFANLSSKLTGGVEITNNATDITLTTAATALTSTTDELAVKLQSVTGGILSVNAASGTNGYESITLNSTGSTANTLTGIDDGTATTLSTLKVTGDRDLTISNALSSEVKTVDATNFTGKLHITHTTPTVVNLIGGSNDDTFVLGNTYIGSEDPTTANRDIINGGAGRDTLSITSAVAVTTTPTTVSNVEIIHITDAVTGNIDLTKFSGADTLSFGNATIGAHNFTLGNNNTLEFTTGDSGDHARTFTIAGLGIADTLTIDAVAGTDFGSGTQTFNGIEVLNINTGTVAGSAVAIGGAVTFIPTPAGSSKLVFSGVNSIDIDGNLTMAEINASGLSGNAVLDMGTTTAQDAIKVTGSGKNDIIRGSADSDILIAGAGNDTLTGLAGDDSIDITGGGSNTLVFANNGANNGKDTITGFNAGVTSSGGDVLDVSEFLGSTPNALTTPANLTDAVQLAAGSIQIVKLSATIANKQFAGTDFGDLFGAGNVFSTSVADNATAVILVQGTDQTQILYVSEALNNTSDTTIVAGDIVVVGVLNGVTNADTFVAANFA